MLADTSNGLNCRLKCFKLNHSQHPMGGHGSLSQRPRANIFIPAIMCGPSGKSWPRVALKSVLTSFLSQMNKSYYPHWLTFG